MHPVVRRRLRPIVTVWPCIGVVDGDKSFGEPYVLKGYVEPKQTFITTRVGNQVETKFIIILDGTDVGKIKDTDEIATTRIARTPVISIAEANGLNNLCELVEVYI